MIYMDDNVQRCICTVSVDLTCNAHFDLNQVDKTHVHVTVFTRFKVRDDYVISSLYQQQCDFVAVLNASQHERRHVLRILHTLEQH